MKKITFILLAAAMMMAGCKQKTEPVAADTDNIYQFSVLDGNLDTVRLSDYQGKVLLVVNTMLCSRVVRKRRGRRTRIRRIFR